MIHVNSNYSIALYGLGTETERLISQWGDEPNIICLLDGFKESGEAFGYPIYSLQQAIKAGVDMIIVVARPGSCKAITKRIGDTCRENNIKLFDIRCNDLLEKKEAAYDFGTLSAYKKIDLIKLIDKSEIVSFDLFDTLVMRKVPLYTDVFELLEKHFKKKGIKIERFANLRVMFEKQLSVDCSPRLEEIYKNILSELNIKSKTDLSVDFAQMEFDIDFSILTPRYAMRDIFNYAVKAGKRVVITTDTYYSREQIEKILSAFGLNGYSDVLVSCEENTAKTQELFSHLVKLGSENVDHEGCELQQILHVGDDETSDIDSANGFGINTFRIYSGNDLFNALNGLEMEEVVTSLSDKIRLGLFISTLFNDPFVFEQEERKLCIKDSFNIGYALCAPMITDFTLWLYEKMVDDKISQVLFCARDGFVIDQLFSKINNDINAVYFLTSRTAAIRAGIESEKDIEYVDSMKFFGTEEENLNARFGVSGVEANVSRDELILKRAEVLRERYKKYIDKLGLSDENTGVFDFVAKGTSQMYMQRLMSGKLKGYYFLQLEPEFMADKNLDIEPFYKEEEKNSSAIYDNYYILETFLTSRDPSVMEFDEEGKPVYAKETRSAQDIECIVRAQKGIISYFEDFISIVPQDEFVINKKLDELMLTIINHVKIEDKDFLSLKVEDPFFGRSTDIKDVIG